MRAAILLGLTLCTASASAGQVPTWAAGELDDGGSDWGLGIQLRYSIPLR